MACFSRLEVLTTILDLGLVPVFYHQDTEVAKEVVAACAAGGARVVEFTNRGITPPRSLANCRSTSPRRIQG